MIRTVIAHPFLFVRDEPALSGTILGRLLPGTRVEVLNDSIYHTDDLRWFQIRWRLGSAYAAGRWLSDFRFDAWPTPFHFVITQAFGANPENYRQFYGDDRGHQGLDFGAPIGSAVHCVAPGLVRMVYLDPRPRREGGHNFGIHCRVQHRDGFETIYAHMQMLRVAAGEEVPAGAVLGRADSTGHSFGNHLHLHFKNYGRVLDPTPFVDELQRRLAEASDAE